MVRIDSSSQFNMYVRYGNRKRSDFDSDFLTGDESTELMNASEIILMLSGRKLGSVLDGLFPEKNQSDSDILAWLDPQVSMDNMSPARFANLLEDITKSISTLLLKKTDDESDVKVLKNNKLMIDFVDDLNRLSKQIKVRAKVVTPNA